MRVRMISLLREPEMKSVLIMALLVLVAGCSNRAVYENIQINKRNQCLQGPQAAYDECMEGTEKPYEKFEQERREYLEERENVADP